MAVTYLPLRDRPVLHAFTDNPQQQTDKFEYWLATAIRRFRTARLPQEWWVDTITAYIENKELNIWLNQYFERMGSTYPSFERFMHELTPKFLPNHNIPSHTSPFEEAE